MVRLGPEVGVAVAVLHAGRETYLNFGRVETPAGVAAPTRETLFEIGSITKAFTGVLFAEALERGEVKLGDSLSEHLPGGWAAREFAPHRPVTLLSLATHTSGLPPIPPLIGAARARRKDNPYADLTPEKLRARAGVEAAAAVPPGREGGLLEPRRGRPRRCPGAPRRRAKRLRRPGARSGSPNRSRLADTAEALTGEQRSRLAAGRDAKGKPTPGWDFATLPGCGALHSTTRDLVAFARANLGEPRGTLTESCELSHRRWLGRHGPVLGPPHRPRHRRTRPSGTTAAPAATAPCSCSCPKERFAVVVLANADAGDRVDRAALAIARKWLTRPKAPALPAR